MHKFLDLLFLYNTELIGEQELIFTELLKLTTYKSDDNYSVAIYGAGTKILRNGVIKLYYKNRHKLFVSSTLTSTQFIKLTMTI